MESFKNNSNLKNEIENLAQENEKLGLDLWTSFIKYWSLRTAYPFIPTFWFDLMEVDNEFRQVFSDAAANELIKVIKSGKLTKQVLDLIIK